MASGEGILCRLCFVLLYPDSGCDFVSIILPKLAYRIRSVERCEGWPTGDRYTITSSQQYMEAQDVEILQSQLKFTLWFIGILMTVLSFFIIRAFKAQEKKDDDQDKQLINFGALMARLTDSITSIDKSTALNNQLLQQHERHLQKHDLILENLAHATKTKR